MSGGEAGEVNARTDTPVALIKYKRVIKSSIALAESLHLIEAGESHVLRSCF